MIIPHPLNPQSVSYQRSTVIYLPTVIYVTIVTNAYREITLEVLGQEPVGAFMVRESTSKPGCFALSLRVPQEFQPLGIAHYLILRTNKGYKIKVNILEQT